MNSLPQKSWQTIEDMLSESLIVGKGIDLKRLVSQLKGKGYIDERIISMPENEQKIRQMMTQIELTDGEETMAKSLSKSSLPNWKK